MIKKRVVVLFILLIMAVFAVGCASDEEQTGDASENNEEEPLQIYTTIFAWEDFANKIGGEEVEVENVVPAGGDAHSFEPTSKTMVDIAEGDAFMYNGAGMEGFAEAVNDTIQNEGALSIEVAEGIDLNSLSEDHSHEDEEEHNHDSGDVDPHLWLDPVLAKEAAENIKDALIELRPEKEETFEENFVALEQDLEELDESFSETVTSTENNEFVVSHAAYGYWEDRYGLNQTSVSGVSPSDEPSQKELQDIIETVEEAGIQHILFEENVSSKVTEVVQEEVGAEALYLHNLSTRTEEEIDNGNDYFDLMEQNIENIDTALQTSSGDIDSEENHESDDHNHDHDH
ncbi:zinc transport system substrate-binding protein [Salibacterium salarium]|uniref:metal ABC transporter solute-binding protein, Zn/Mn family n=1 Tax=Salibacterium salarium TaxID=284579 RepID=UPI002783CBF0|nr:zinc ABC transporter substrate-binding protein [Salibacterium salarium]MDQ0300252.1 zinc transport system substrate-binding protein [Salibacterium salarium]